MSKPKPKMTEEIRQGEWKLDYDPERFSSGGMRFKFEDCTARVLDDGKEIGSVSGCIGAGISVEINGRSWFLSAKAIWEMAAVADAAYVESLAAKARRR